jgi:hypothetical protein
MHTKDYLIVATNKKEYNIRLCEIVATGSESKDFDRLFIIYKTPEGEYLKRVKHFHPVAGAPELIYKVISAAAVSAYHKRKFA